MVVPQDKITTPDIHIQEPQNQEDLNKLAQCFENEISVLCKIKNLNIQGKKHGPNQQKKCLVDKNKKHEIRGLYDHQKHRALQEILFGPTYYCEIEADKIEKHYLNILNEELKSDICNLPQHLWQKDAPSQDANSSLTKNCTPKEVKAKLEAKINSPLYSSRSVGLDRISFRHLRYVDFSCSRMASLFNSCLRLQSVPEKWMEFYSVLVKATDGDDFDIKNWRTITMQRTISKLFQTLLAARLIVWAKKTERLSATQKGFLMNNAACESSFILQECKNYAQDKGKDLCVAWLDFTNASEFVPQTAVLHALNKHSVPSQITKIIQNMLQFSNTKIRTKHPVDYTNPIKILKGLPQGSPIDPILLDFVMEPVLRDLLASENNVFEIYNKKINHYAIPNELILIAETPSNLQSLLNLVEKNARLIGIKFNIPKCATYHYNDKDKEMKLDSSFLFFGQNLTILPKENVEEYFGVKQGLSIGQEDCPTVQEMIDSIEAINSCLLDVYQKTESILLYIIPRVENCLRGLQNIDTVSFEKADQVLKNSFKVWLDLPDDTTVESIIYHVKMIQKEMTKPIEYNYLPFVELYYIMKISHALNMLTSKDDIVKTIAFDSLTTEVNSLLPIKKKINVTKEHLAQFLSGELQIQNKKSKSLWYMVREATLKLKIKMSLRWQYDNGMQLIVKPKNMKKKNILTGNYSCNAEEKLKNILVNYYVSECKKKNSDLTATVEITKSDTKKNTPTIQESSSVLKVATAAVGVPLPLTTNFPMLYTHF